MEECTGQRVARGNQFTLPGSEFIVNLPIAYAYAYAIDLFYIYFIGLYDSISIGEGNSTIMICR